MKEKKIKSLEGYGEFREVCFPIRLEDEYPGWTGEEKWGLVTGLSEDVLIALYPEIMEALSPYLVLPPEYGEIRDEYRNSERRSRRRQEQYESYFDQDCEAGCCEELVSADFTEELADRELLREALACLTELQRKRIVQLYCQGMSLKEIAESEGEGVNPSSVWRSVRLALKKMRSFIEGFGGEI